MSDWSVRYYESTAVRGHEAGGGLSEYYSERDTRAPVVLVAQQPAVDPSARHSVMPSCSATTAAVSG